MSPASNSSRSRNLPRQDRLRRRALSSAPPASESAFTLAAGRDIATSPKYRLLGWSLPSKLVTDRLARGEGVPIATFVPTQKARRGDPAVFNVVLTRDGVELVPGLLMPTDSFGFGKVAPPLAGWRHAGSVVWSELPQDTPRLELSGKLDRKAKQYVLDLRCGKRGAVVQVPEPHAKG